MATPSSPLWSEYERYIREVILPIRFRFEEIVGSWRQPDFWIGRQTGSRAIQTPIQHFEAREKRLESVLDKFQRQKRDFPDGRMDPNNLRRMRDVFGGRIVVYVPEQLRIIDELIRSSPDLEVDASLKPRSYLPAETFRRIGFGRRKFELKGQKASGYASLHYFVRLREPVASENPIFEIQTRTMLEQVWGEIEHQLGYKIDQGTEFSVTRQFRVISHHLSALDDHFDFLYDRLTYLQARSNPVDDDWINAENLPAILHDFQILLVQGEVDGLLRILGTYDINRVGDLRARLDARLLDPIRRAHQQRLGPGEPLRAFDVIPALVQISPQANVAVALAAYEDAVEAGDLIQRLRRESREKRRERKPLS